MAHSDFCRCELLDGSENLAALTHHKPSAVRVRQAALCYDFPIAPHLSPVSHLCLQKTIFENESVLSLHLHHGQHRIYGLMACML